MFTKWRVNQQINKLKIETDKEAIIIAKQWKMRKFVITNRRINEAFPDIYNGALNTESRRIYIYKLPLTTVDFLMNELLEISEGAEAVSVEFDQYKGGHNVEIEIYLRESDSEDLIPSVFDAQRIPNSVKISERFYFELISQLERNVM